MSKRKPIAFIAGMAILYALDGGIPSCLHIERRWPAATDANRYCWPGNPFVKP